MKRIVDLIVSLLLLIIISPLIGVVWIGVRMKFGTPVLFKQKRPGQNGIPFNILKFRTMTNGYDHNGNYLPDIDRLTRFGKFLRRYSLDELPQLLNVLMGDMSLVGPRPLLMSYLERYSSQQARRHEVKPGITGWAQINGRNALSWVEKFKLDVWYVDNHSMFIDLKILYYTFIKVIRSDGINNSKQVTMNEFTGEVGEEKS